MIKEPLAVLKFGSSVLRTRADLPSAVAEIYRFRRRGFQVLAVVSALGETTDGLLRAARERHAEVSGELLAEILAAGEHASVLWLSLELERAGLPHRRLDVGGLGLVADGDPLDALPQRLDRRGLDEAFSAAPIVLVPGFVGRNDVNRTVLLGRGGSDLSAVFLAKELRAAVCRLLKDTEGLYECDPASTFSVPNRYSQITYGEARSRAGVLFQDKALALAERHHLIVEVAKPASRRTTWVGTTSSRLEVPQVDEAPLRVILLGHGAVGSAVRKRLLAHPEFFETVGVLVRQRGSPRHTEVPSGQLFDDPRRLEEIKADIVVEMTGGETSPLPLLAAALWRGCDVVSANKSLLARARSELASRAADAQRFLVYSAAVGGSAPILEMAAQVGRRHSIRRVCALLNGTANFVLEQVRRGVPLAKSIQYARDRGFAEADVQTDFSGQDAAAKAVLLAHAAFGRVLRLDEIEMPPSGFMREFTPGSPKRQVVDIELVGGILKARVQYREIEECPELNKLRGVDVGCLFETADGSRHFVHGAGAGGEPTAEAVLADLLDIYRWRRQWPAPPGATFDTTGLLASSV